MQMGVAKTRAHLFDKFADQAPLVFIKRPQLREQSWINFNL